jgi:hypothetical protein
LTEDLAAELELFPLASLKGNNVLTPPAPLIESGTLKLFVLASLFIAKFAISAKELSTEMP